MPVKGATAVKSYLRTFQADVEDKKTVQALNAILQIGMASAVYYAPIEYGVLVNSRRQSVERVDDQWRAVGGFYVKYASYLEYNPYWTAKPPEEKDGPAWNINARPGFLKYGFENPDSQRQIYRTLDIIYKGGL